MDMDKMRDYVRRGLWPKRYLDNLLSANRITQEQYNDLLPLIPNV